MHADGEKLKLYASCVKVREIADVVFAVVVKP